MRTNQKVCEKCQFILHILTQFTGQTRHFLENSVTIGEGDKNAEDGLPINDEDSGKVITSYTGPGPAEGSGPHRYQFLLLKQPQDFQAPEGLDSENTPLGKMNIADYIDSTDAEIVAATFFIVEVGESTVSVKPTSTVNTASVSATPSSTDAASDDGDDADAQDATQDDDDDSSATKAAVSAMFMVMAVAAIAIV